MTTVVAVEANEGLLPLLPPERWAARRFRQRKSYRGQPMEVVEQNYGPDGTTLFGAALLWVQTGMALGFFVFFPILFASLGRGPLYATAIWLLLPIYVLLGVGIGRCVQASRRGREFRGPRPFIRRGAIFTASAPSTPDDLPPPS